jgi:formylglycine-generating enzyme required for sulfatase activity
MAGNVWQWVQDCYSRNYDQAPTDGSASTGQDCTYRVARGGAWTSGPSMFDRPSVFGVRPTTKLSIAAFGSLER